MADPSLTSERAVAAASGLYIGGSWRAGADRLEVADPATGAFVGEVVAASAEHAREAVAAAHAAFPARRASASRRAASRRRRRAGRTRA